MTAQARKTTVSKAVQQPDRIARRIGPDPRGRARSKADKPMARSPKPQASEPPTRPRHWLSIKRADWSAEAAGLGVVAVIFVAAAILVAAVRGLLSMVLG